MLLQNYPYFYLFFISSAIAGFTTYYAWKRRTVRYSRSFIILMSLVTWYVFFYGCEIITTDPSLHILFIKIEYLAIPWISGLLVLFSLEFGGYVQNVTKKQLFAIFLLPSLLFVSYFTDSIHHQYYQDISYLVIDNLTVVSITPGILYYILVSMNTVAIIISFIIMIQVYRNASRFYRSQLILVIVSMGILIVGMAFFLLLPRRYPDFDIFPLFLSFVGLMLLTAIFRFQFFDMMYIPYRNIFGYLEEGIVVLDPDNRILEMNREALFLLDLDSEKVQGEELGSLKTILNEHMISLTGNDSTQIRIHKKTEKNDSYLFLEMYPVFDSFSQIQCRMIIIRDITKITKTHMALTEAGKKLNLLNSITRHDILNQIAVISGYSELLMEEFPDGSAYRVDLERIKDSSDSIRNLIQFTATYQNLGVSDPVWLDVSDTVLKAWRTLHPPESVTIRNETNLVVFADMLLEKVFFNLMDNSLRHGGDIHYISVSSYEKEDRTILVYRDDGCGVLPGEKEKIFSKGFGKNTGYGLFLVKEILSITSIDIRENGTYGSGVRFEMKIPSNGVKNRTIKQDIDT